VTGRPFPNELLPPDDELSDDQLDDIALRIEAISVAKTATQLPGFYQLFAAIADEQERNPPKTLCWHCGERQFVGMWWDRGHENLLCLCSPCAAEIAPVACPPKNADDKADLSLWWTPRGWLWAPTPSQSGFDGSREVLVDESVGEPDGQTGLPIYPLVAVAWHESGCWFFMGEGYPTCDGGHPGYWGFFVAERHAAAFRKVEPPDDASAWADFVPRVREAVP